MFLKTSVAQILLDTWIELKFFQWLKPDLPFTGENVVLSGLRELMLVLPQGSVVPYYFF